MERTTIPAIIARLKANADVFAAQLAQVSRAQARWKPTADKWSLLEVTCHLADEERDDFRRRLDLTLHHPGAPWPPIDPPRWAIERKYGERDLSESLADFLQERAASISWLEGLGAFDLDATANHPKLGPMTAGQLFTSWLAHDLIHIRQVNRLHFEYLTQATSTYPADYAGAW